MSTIILYRDVSTFYWPFIVLIKWQEREQTLKHVMCYTKMDVKKGSIYNNKLLKNLYNRFSKQDRKISPYMYK